MTVPSGTRPEACLQVLLGHHGVDGGRWRLEKLTATEPARVGRGLLSCSRSRCRLHRTSILAPDLSPDRTNRFWDYMRAFHREQT